MTDSDFDQGVALVVGGSGELEVRIETLEFLLLPPISL